jgi:hypothetical protein
MLLLFTAVFLKGPQWHDNFTLNGIDRAVNFLFSVIGKVYNDLLLPAIKFSNVNTMSYIDIL